MKFKHLHAFLAFLVGCFLMSCHSELDLDNLDATMEAQVKLALPIGTIKAKVSDFLKSNDAMHLVQEADGSYTWSMEFRNTSTFDYFDFDSKINKGEFTFNMYKQLEHATYGAVNPMTGEPIIDPTTGKQLQVPIMQAAAMLGVSEINLPAQCKFSDTISFDLPVPLAGINKPGANARVDKTTLKTALFNLSVDKLNFEGITWEWIDKITIDLGDFVTSQEGLPSRRVLYDASVNPTGSTTTLEMPLDLSKSVLNAMKDQKAAPSDVNVVDTLKFKTIIAYHIPAPTTISIHENSGLQVDFTKAAKLGIGAVWGWFNTTKDLKAGDTINISKQLDSIPFLKSSSLPLADPQIDMWIRTKVAGDVRIDGELFALDKNNNRKPAMFSGKPFFSWIYTPENGALDPIQSSLTDTAKIHLWFDHTEEHGHIDELFMPMPDRLAFNVLYNFDKSRVNQVRVTEDLFVDFYAKATLPLKFKDGFKFDFTDTMPGVAISQLQIDSLLGKVPMIDSMHVNKITLYMNIEDSIPLDIFATFYCTDKSGKTIMDPENPERAFTLFPQDTIQIAGAISENGQLIAQRTTLQCQLTQAQANLFPQIESIIYHLEAAQPTGGEKNGTQIKGSYNLKIGLALAADVDAYLNPASDKNKKNN